MKLRCLLVVVLFVTGCSDTELEAPPGPAEAKLVPENWSVHVHNRQQAIELHLKNHQQAYQVFANFPVSQTDGIPYLMLKLLPLVAPALWPDSDNFLSVVGLYNDERQPAYPIARGIGFTGLSRDLNQQVVDRASFTCGGCHIGRVKDTQGRLIYLDGGINSEFNTVGFRKRMVETLDVLEQGLVEKADKDKQLVTVFLAALEKVEKERPGYFYKNYQYQQRRFDTEYEKQQIALFKQQADTLIPAYAQRIREVYSGWRTLVEKNYETAFDDLMKGYAGTEDAIAFNSVDAYLNFKRKKLLSLFAGLAMASEPGVTDIMAVWDQQNRNPEWNEGKDNLINGGGQWNGHIPLLIYKNLAAQLTLGVDNVDVAVSAFSEELLEKLPAPAYPFDVDVDLAKKGRQLFQQNCVVCHRDNNGKVYRNIGTDTGRAKIAGRLITAAAQDSFTEVCGPETIVKMHGKNAKPCASYRGVSLKGKKQLAMTKSTLHDGYNALPLVGIWAQAPYLHNGSVPTIYHLLLPATRPDVFRKSRLDYDTEKLGFAWSDESRSSADAENSYLFDTTQASSLGHQGHDKDINMNGNTYRLDWSGDESSVMAIIEYMKTL